MSRTRQAKRGDGIACPNDKGPTVAAVAPLENKHGEKPDCHGATLAGQALRVIEGEGHAACYLTRLHAQQTDADELAVTVSTLYCGALRGFCGAIEKALEVEHG